MTLRGKTQSLLTSLSILSLVLCCGCNSAEMQILRDDLKRCQEDVARASVRTPGAADGTAAKIEDTKAQTSPEVATAAQGPKVQGQSGNSKDQLARAREEITMLKDRVEMLSAELSEARSRIPKTEEKAQAKLESLLKEVNVERSRAQSLRQQLNKIESGILAYCRKYDDGCNKLRRELGP